MELRDAVIYGFPYKLRPKPKIASLTYRTAGNIGSELKLAVWRLAKRPSNLNPSNLSAIYVYTYYFTRARARILYVRNYRQI